MYSDDSEFEISEEEKIPWPHCSKRFTAQGLGGHKAKAHKGLNHEYQEKLKVRKMNKNNLEILRLAQQQYKIDTNSFNIISSKIPRSIIIRNKKLIQDKINFMWKIKGVKIEEAIETLKEAQRNRYSLQA